MGTVPGKAELTAIHLTVHRGANRTGEALGHPDLGQVDHRVTALTNEVDMGHCVAIQPLHSADSSQTGNQPLLLEQGDVPVNRGQRDVGAGVADLLKDPVRAGMDIRGSDAMQDRVPLAKMLGLLHRHLLVENDSCLHPQDIIEFHKCQ